MISKMKNLKVVLTTLVMLFVSVVSFGQTVNGVQLKDIDVEYVQIVGTSKLFSKDLTIQIDFGQKNKIFDTKDTRLVDSDGRDVVLHSMVDALNFMTKHEYYFVTAYAISIPTSAGNQNVYHFLLKKNKEN
jgi:hypothetical protein